MAVLTSASAGGMVARRLLPAAIGLPFVLGWLRLVGERAGLWSFGVGWALFALSALILFVVIIWRSALVLHATDMSLQRLQTAVRELQRAEDALEESERRYRTLVEFSRGLICIHDLDGNVLSVNPATARILGYTPSDLVGKNLRDLLSPSVRDLFPDYLSRIRDGGVDEGVMRVVTRDGQERIWAYCNVRIDEVGRSAEVLGHAHDITELKRAEHLAREASALRSVAQLANAAAHEINNPLAIVSGQLQMLKRSMLTDTKALTRIEKASEAVSRITAIIARMARITRLESLDLPPGSAPMLDVRPSSSAIERAASTPDEPSTRI